MHMSGKDKIIKAINGSTKEISAFGVKRIGLFGSYAGDHQNVRSDVDILVEFNKGEKEFDNYMGLKLYLEKLFHCRIDLVIKDALKTKNQTQDFERGNLCGILGSIWMIYRSGYRNIMGYCQE